MIYPERGMTLRDYFAGQALAGMLVLPPDTEALLPDVAAKGAYKFADAMLRARE